MQRQIARINGEIIEAPLKTKNTEVIHVSEGRVTARLRADHEDVYQVSRDLFFAFSQWGVPLLELTPKKASLEDIFLELAENDETAPETEIAGGEVTAE